VKRAVEYVSTRSLDDAAEHWLSEIRSLVRPRPHLELDVRRCALIVTDMVNYFATPGGRAFLPAALAVAPRIALLLDAFRSCGAPVVFTRHGHDGPDDLGMLGRFYSDHIREGAQESELVAWLAPRPGEAVLRKRTYDSFVGTDLEGLLRRQAVDQVLVTGVLTHLCCETTARSAFVRGFEVYVAADATATTTERLHLGSLLALADGFAPILSAREVAARCLTLRSW
jgi:nicotinamidase-related amidase